MEESSHDVNSYGSEGIRKDRKRSEMEMHRSNWTRIVTDLKGEQ